jgi:hypothetical protein
MNRPEVEYIGKHWNTKKEIKMGELAVEIIDAVIQHHYDIISDLLDTKAQLMRTKGGKRK